MSEYIKHHTQIEVCFEGAKFVIDADISGKSALIYGIKLSGKWWHADVLSIDFCEDLTKAIDEIPLNCDGDVPSDYYRLGTTEAEGQ
jgi:hypothetical protein